MRLSALAKPLALAAALTLAMAACTDKTDPPNNGSSGGSDGGASTPAISLPVPDGFNTDNPVIEPTALDTAETSKMEGIEADLSPDGTHLATWLITDTTVTVTELDLTTGETVEHKPFEGLLTPEDRDKPLVEVRYTSDDQFSILTSGVIEGEGASEDTEKWKLATYNSGHKADPQVIEQDGEASFERVSFGPIVDVAAGRDSERAYVDVANETVTVEKVEPLEGCTNSRKCEVPVRPSVLASDILISSYEQKMALSGADCSTDPNASNIPGSGCLTGFRTDAWTSADEGIAPEDALPTYARLAGTDGKFILGAWATPDNSTTIYRIIDPAHPTDDNGSFTVEGSVPDYDSEARLNFSPDHTYLNVGLLTADLSAGTGVAYGSTDGVEAAVFGGVTDEGTAWGEMGPEDEGGQSMVLPWRPSSTAITATAGTTTSKSVEGEVNLPIQVITTPNGPAGVFINNKAEGGKPAVAVYPVG